MILRFGLFILKPYCLILHFPKNLPISPSRALASVKGGREAGKKREKGGKKKKKEGKKDLT